MTSGWLPHARGSLLKLLTLLAVLVLLQATQPGAQAAQPAGAQALLQAEFCETRAPFDEAGCRWQSVRLPHRFEPAAAGFAWGLYRLELAHPGAGAHALLAERVSLHARVRVAGAEIASSPNSPLPGHTVRYWPQLYAFSLGEPAQPGQPLQLLVALQGHGHAKSGIGSLAVASLGVAQAWQWRENLLEVNIVLALAGATLLSGLIGLAACTTASLPGRILLVFSCLAFAAASRTALNFVVVPPLPPAWWTALNLWLLITISTLICLGVGLYLGADPRRGLAAAVLGLASSALLLAALPGALLYPAAEAVLGLLALAGAALVAGLAARVWRSRDRLGVLLLGALLMVMLTGVHDLLVHLGPDSLSDRYVQRWSAPGVVIIIIVLLTRHLAAQRQLQASLARETGRREELLRDLHDGVGSRLVALAFHARRQDPSGSLGQEIQGLMHELQVIQRAVQPDPTTLAALLADLRHLYTRAGGGTLPLHWEVDDEACGFGLTPEQVLATLRILQEAVANALRHAQPNSVRIRVAARGEQAGVAAVLSVIDDGVGQFRPGASGGLHNMRVRAERAGLALELEPLAAGKAVHLRFPITAPRAGLLQRLQAAWAGPRANSATGDRPPHAPQGTRAGDFSGRP